MRLTVAAQFGSRQNEILEFNRFRLEPLQPHQGCKQISSSSLSSSCFLLAASLNSWILAGAFFFLHCLLVFEKCHNCCPKFSNLLQIWSCAFCFCLGIEVFQISRFSSAKSYNFQEPSLFREACRSKFFAHAHRQSRGSSCLQTSQFSCLSAALQRFYICRGCVLATVCTPRLTRDTPAFSFTVFSLTCSGLL